MSNYRRVKKAGGLFFFTVVTYHRQKIFNTPKYCALLRETIISVKAKYPFDIKGWVLMPDHIHCIWQLPENDDRNSLRWGQIKSGFSKRVKPDLHTPEWINRSKLNRRESTIWQRRYWEHLILDDNDYLQHMNYIHYNPVKHGLVRQVKEWPHSTFHRLVKEGIYSEGWGGNVQCPAGQQFGE